MNGEKCAWHANLFAALINAMRKTRTDNRRRNPEPRKQDMGDMGTTGIEMRNASNYVCL